MPKNGQIYPQHNSMRMTSYYAWTKNGCYAPNYEDMESDLSLGSYAAKRVNKGHCISCWSGRVKKIIPKSLVFLWRSFL